LLVEAHSELLGPSSICKLKASRIISTVAFNKSLVAPVITKLAEFYPRSAAKFKLEGRVEL
jgi:hypothetical protein